MTSYIITGTPESSHEADVSSRNDPGKSEKMHLENVATNATNDDLNFHYEEVDEEPELHMRTWIAIAAVCVMNLVQTIAVQGPPAVVRIQDPGTMDTAISSSF